FFASPDDPAYVLHEGTYYQLGSVIVDEVSETYPVLRLFETEDTTETPVDGSENGGLPEADQHAVQIAHMAARAWGNEGGFPSGLVQRGGYVYRPETARTESELLTEDGPDYVTYRETTYAVEITREEFYEAIYRPTADPVEASGTVVLEDRFEPGLHRLEAFSHVMVIAHLHESSAVRLRVRPGGATGEVGIFATSGPARPNPIGVSVLSLEGVEGPRLTVSELDLVDGTPVLDVKPYAPKDAHLSGLRRGWMADAI
ncbi:MAG: SAM-dependent methyltransferase, partial [Halanaeroarchaeum sp.]